MRFPEGKLPLWYRLKTYFMHNFSSKGHQGHFWIRTPLFAIGYYRTAWLQNASYLQTGFEIDWIPAKWNLDWPRGHNLYKKHWDNLKFVGLVHENSVDLTDFKRVDALKDCSSLFREHNVVEILMN